MIKIKQVSISTLRVLAYGLLCFATLEICARVDDAIRWGAPLWGTYSKDTLFVVDSVGYRNQPNAKFEKWKINNFGFRGKDIERRAPEGVTRIMVLGSSVAFGLHEEPGKEYPAQLEAKLNRDSSGRYQVINGGVPAINIPLLRHLYEHWLADFKPDVVIYTPWSTSYLKDPPPGPHNLDMLSHHRSAPFEFRIPAKSKIVMRSSLPASLQTAISEISTRIAKANHRDDTLLMHVPMDRVRLFADQLTGFVQMIQQSGARVILLTRAIGVNAPFSDHERRWLNDWRRRYPLVADETLLEMVRLGNQALSDVARQTGCKVIDIDARIPKTTDYFADHVHFTSAGAGMMADLLVPELSQRTP